MPEWSFFDANAMVGATLVPPPGALRDAGALLRAMDHYGIQEALVYHHAGSYTDMNRRTLEMMRQSKRLWPCWVLPVSYQTIGEKLEDAVDRMLEAGVKAARFVAEEGSHTATLHLRHWQYGELLDRLDRHKVPLMLSAEHFDTPAAATGYGWDEIHELCKAYPDMPVVLLQPRGLHQAPLIALMRRHRNLYFTIPWFGLFRQLENLVDMFGAERALFGANMPYTDPGLPLGMVNYGKFTVAQKKLIAGDNLRRLLRNVS